MSISTIYRVSHTLPNGLADYLGANFAENDKFNRAMSYAQQGNIGAGSDSYSDRSEWAEFTEYTQARAADNAMRKVVFDWHCKAIKA